MLYGPRNNVAILKCVTSMEKLDMVAWPRLFKGWITLSTGKIAIQRISVDKTNHAIHRIVIYPVDSVIHFSNNRDLVFSVLEPAQAVWVPALLGPW